MFALQKEFYVWEGFVGEREREREKGGGEGNEEEGRGEARTGG